MRPIALSALSCLWLAAWAAVSPQAAAASELPDTLTDVRLAGGSSSNQGRLEVQGSDGTWYSSMEICVPVHPAEGGAELISDLETTLARVACRQLGFTEGGRPLEAYTPGMAAGVGAGRGAGGTLSALLMCGGNETSVDQCDLVESECEWEEGPPESDPLFEQPEATRTKVAIACGGSLPLTGDLRLVGGSSPTEGRVEARLSSTGAWTSLCQASQAPTTAQVVCRQLGLPGPAALRVGLFDGPAGSGSSGGAAGSGRADAEVLQCSGRESKLGDCLLAAAPTSSCLAAGSLGVACGAAAPTITALRLASGPTPRAGRLEIRINGTWGTVSGHATTPIATAAVACRHLGFGAEASEPRGSSFYGDGQLPVLLRGISCTGGESNLSECHFTGLGSTGEGACNDDSFGVACDSDRATAG